MPTASSIQIVNDANGTAHAFLEDDGAIWQCRWNSEAQRWDRGQVVPGAYGSEQLQALYLPDLWPTTDANGNNPAKAPGIVLAYRLGEGDAAKVVAILGGWGSDGQLSWSEPLELNASGNPIERLALTRNGSGGFDLVCQEREPLGLGTEKGLSQTAAIAARKDSELTSLSFAVQGSNVNGYSLGPATGGTPAQPITPATLPPSTAPAAPAVGGGTVFSRADLQLAPAALQTASPTLQNGPLPGGLRLASAPQAQDNRLGWANWQFKSPNQSANLSVGVKPLAQSISWKIDGKKVPLWGGGKSDPRSGLKRGNKEQDSVNENSTSLFAGGATYGVLDKTNKDISLSGSFGAGSFGQASTKTSATLGLERTIGEAKTRKLGTAAAAASADAVLRKSEWTFSFSGSLSTTYKYIYNSRADAAQKLSALQKTQQTASLSIGFAYGYKQRFESGAFVLIKLGVDGGFTEIRSVKPQSGQSMANYLARSGVALGIIGNLEAYAQAVGNGVNLLRGKDLSTTAENTRVNGATNFGFISTKEFNFAPAPYAVKAINAGIGGTGAILPYLATDSSVYKITNQYGFQENFKFAGTFLAKGLIGANLVVSAGSKQLWQKQIVSPTDPRATESLGVNLNLALPFGITIPIFTVNKDWQQPGLPTVSLSVAPSSVAEDGSDGIAGLTYTFARTGTTTDAPKVYFTITGTADRSDYELLGPVGSDNTGTYVTFTEGQDTVAVVVTPQPDALVGSDETVVFQIQAQKGYNVGTATPVTGIITDSSVASSSGSQDSAPQSTLSTSQAEPVVGSNQAPLAGQADQAYPFTYAPASGSTLLPGSVSPGALAAQPLTGKDNQALQLFQLAGFSFTPTTASRSTAAVLQNPGSGLLDGTYTDIPVLGVSLPGSPPATLNFTVSGGKVDATQPITINAPSGNAGQYLLLPQTTASSGIYALIPDVIGAGILPAPSGGSAALSASSLLSQLPLITVDTTRAATPLRRPVSIAAIQPSIPLVSASAQAPVTLANATPSDNGLISYSGVAVTLINPATQQPIGIGTATGSSQPTLLNQATATVSLSNGTIVSVLLDQPLYLANAPANLTLSLDLQSVLGDQAVASNPAYSVVPQTQAVNNVVEDYNYSSNPVAMPTSSPAVAVWLTDGINDQLQATPNQAAWPVFNRVTVLDGTTNQLTYLNASITSSNGVVTQTTKGPQDLTLLALYNNLTDPSNYGLVPNFTAASTPTAIPIAGTETVVSGKTNPAATAVFWVEASEPVIPEVSDDGSQNYQAYMAALYGNQRINYRIYEPQKGGWQSPNTLDLYSPTDAVIRHLKGFTVEVAGSPRTLLVWDETSIDAIKETPPQPIDLQGWISGTTLMVTSSARGLRIGDLIGGDQVEKGTVITGILSPFDQSSGGSAVYRISRSQTLGSTSQSLAIKATPLLPPTELKAGFINPAALNSNVQWDTLFTDEQGQSTITTIPWDQANDISLGIESLAVASQQRVGSNGEVSDTAVLSWSQNVRTPYVESVLNDEPLIFLQFSGLSPGASAINIGSTGSGSPDTAASDTGLNFTIAGALPKASGSAVQNLDGTGVLTTTTGSQNSLLSQLVNSMPQDQLSGSPFCQLTASISGTTLTVTGLSGSLNPGDLLTGPGLQPDTQITGILQEFDAASGSGTYTLNVSQSLASTALEALPNPAPGSPLELGLPYASFSGSISGTSLTVSGLSGSLDVGDQIFGKGITPGTTILAVNAFDAASGSGSYTLNESQTLPSSALIASPTSSAPYSIEFWTKLPDGSNAEHGAGLVAFGQPSAEAVGPAKAPEGWLLTANFNVARVSYQQAAAQGSQEAYNALNAQSANPGDLFGWAWSLDATGADTTALNGNGGSNLYSNALTLTNLKNGQLIAGVNDFLASYNLAPQDLIGGDGLGASTIDLVPITSLEFDNSLDASGQPVSSLNAIGIDTSSAQLNSGFVQAINANGDLSGDAQTSANLQSMFNALWAFQQRYGEAKVGFTLAPDASAPLQPQADQFEQYGGYELDFNVSSGPAVSVNNQGRLVFDVANGVQLISAATNPSGGLQQPLPADLRDGDWHYVVATYLPDYRVYTVNGQTTQVPLDRGTASLYVDNQLVASTAVEGAYVAANINDNLLLLANNDGGAIDQLAIYDKALLPTPPLAANPDGSWPQVSEQQALEIFKQLGIPPTAQTPNPGAIGSALTEHWLSRNVNPNGALQATYTSSFTPSSGDSLVGSWSPAAPLNPIPLTQATTPSASAASLQQDLVIAIAPQDWGQNFWTNGSASVASAFNPVGDQLRSITVSLTPVGGGELVTRQLTPSQVLIGANNSVASLQPQASSSDLHYTLLSAQPALNLLISPTANPSNPGDSNNLDLKESYTATVTFNLDESGQSTTTPLTRTFKGFNATGAQVWAAADGSSPDLSTASSLLTSRRKALATAEVLEAAPLQLKYVDSGEVLNSAASLAGANSPTRASPATSFGQSVAYGWFNVDSSTYSGWLAVAQPSSANAISNPAGRVWLQYTGDFTSSDPLTAGHTAVSDPSRAPITWLNALANSNFSPESANLPLLNDGQYPTPYGGLLIEADPTEGWGQNFAQAMLVADVNGDQVLDLVIGAPSANGGGKVVIIDGTWIVDNLTESGGSTILNLSNPEALGPYVTVLSPGTSSDLSSDDASQASFGWALAFDDTSNTLFIGAPNYSRSVGPDSESVPIGAVYHYQNAAASPAPFNDGSFVLNSSYAVGMAGSTSTNDVSGPYTSYWGAQLGASLAVSAEGALAVGAPGVQASLLYSGTEAVEQLAAGNAHPSDPYGQGALIKIQLPTPIQVSTGLDVAVSSSEGTSNSQLTTVSNAPQKKGPSSEQSAYMQALKRLQSNTIAKANVVNNPALQTAAVGSVYLFNKATALQSLSGTLNPAAVANDATGGGATFYGPNPWNTLGDTGFGTSVSFGDLSNQNAASILSIGAPSTGGPGAVYLVDTSLGFSASNAATGQASWISDSNLGSSTLGGNQYLAHLASTLTLYGAQTNDNFGNGVVNLGDVNHDGYNDLLIQAFNASESAGAGYVVFGSDLASGTYNPAVTSVRPGSIGDLSFLKSDTAGRKLSILVEQGSGLSALTGLGSFGVGDVNADGNNDVMLGSGANGQAYLTWGQDYLKAITDLQLQKLTSNNGYILDGLASANQGSLRSVGDFNGDGYGDFISIQKGSLVDTVRLELGANTQEILADYPYNFYTFNVASGTQVIGAGDMNGDGYGDIALFLDQNLSSAAEGNQGAGSTTAILYGRASNALPLGSGFGYLAAVDPSTSAPAAPLPALAMAGGYTDADPSIIAVGDTLYAAVKGAGSGDSSILFSQSNDGGNSWNSWTNLSASQSGFAIQAGTGPSLALFNGRLQLAFLNSSGQIVLSSWDPTSGNPSLWSTPTPLTAGSTTPTSKLAPALISDAGSLSALWVDAASGTLYGSTTTVLDSGWSPETQLLERRTSSGSISFVPISASAAPAVTLLSGAPVLAVNNGGGLSVYLGKGGKSFVLGSTFTTGSVGTIAPGLITTDTGLALTYANPDGSVNLERLNLLQLDGTPVSGVKLSADGSIDASNADLAWQAITLTPADSGLSTALASVPVNVNGMLLLGSVSSASASANQVQLLAVPSLSDPESTTWLNTTVQLGSILSQRAGEGNGIGGLQPGSWSPFQNGTSASQVSLARGSGYTVYAAWQGTNNNLYWSSSSDNGQTWSAAQELPSSMTTKTPPSIACYNGELYLGYVGEGNQQINITYLTNAATNSWNPQYQIEGQSATWITLTQQVSGELGIYFTSNYNNSSTTRILHATSSKPSVATQPNGQNHGTESTWFVTGLVANVNGSQSNLTASGPIAVATYNGQDYLAYQGGTYGSPSSQIVIAGFNSDLSNGELWTILESPAGIEPVGKAAVGLGSTGNGLLLSYTDSRQPDQVSLQVSNPDISAWIAQQNSVPLSSTVGYTPLLTGNAQQPLLIAGVAANQVINTQLSGFNRQIVSSAQTGSNLAAVGDLNADGFDDLIVTANNVAYSPSADFASSDARYVTGLRLVQGGATAAAISGSSKASGDHQNVQIASLYPSQSPISSATPTTARTPDGLVVTGWTSSVRDQLSATLQGTGSFAASAGSPDSLQQLFPSGVAATATAIPSWPPASSFGSPALATLKDFGDLNGDGTNDYLAPDGLARLYTGDGAVAYSVWSLRAAGDVNGNGVDDVLLTLSPAETQGQWLRPVLVDGSLFHVENNLFSFAMAQGSSEAGWSSAGLKAPLNADLYPYSENYVPSLQNWLQGAQTYRAPLFMDDDLLVVAAPQSPTFVDSAFGVAAENGSDYIVSLSSGVLSVNYRNAGVGGGSQLTSATTGLSMNANTISGAAIYRGKLYVACTNLSSSGAAGSLSIACATLPPEGGAPTGWSVITPGNLSGTGALVNEGDRLALYVCNATPFAFGTSPTIAPIQVIYSGDPSNSASWGGTLNGSSFSGPPVSLRGSAAAGGSSATLQGYRLAATRFQGKTVLAYYSGYSSSLPLYEGAAQVGWTLTTAQSDSAEPGSSWSTFTSPTSDGLPQIFAQASQKQAAPLLSLSASSSLLYLMQNFGSNSAVAGNAFGWDGFASGGPQFLSYDSISSLGPAVNQNYLGLSGYVSQSHFLVVQPSLNVLADAYPTITTPATPSLAGYSVDGNIDINGDGFMDMLVSDPSDPSQGVDNQYALFGGDFANIASKVGTIGDDVLVGTPLQDVIYSLQGADQVTSNGGADVIYTGAGDDKISIVDNAFVRIDAGAGFNTLSLQGRGNQAFDFRLDVDNPQYFAGTKLRNIQLISSQDYGANSLAFDAAAVNAINPDRVLFLTPDAADNISLSSEFNRNPNFDTSYAGNLWSAYVAASADATPADTTPALVYVLTPVGQTGDWLDSHVLIDPPSMAASAMDGEAAPLPGAMLRNGAAPMAQVDPTDLLPKPSSIASRESFGDGLSMVAYRSDPGTGLVRFAIERSDTSKRQVITYASSDYNSLAQPGRDYTAVAGLLVLEVGQSRQEITVPIDEARFARLRGGSVSLVVEEAKDGGQQPLHLLLAPKSPGAASADAAAPVLSGFELTPSGGGDGATLRFRADSNGSAGGPALDQLQLIISERASADASSLLKSRDVSIRDFRADGSGSISSPSLKDLPLDHDERANQQISAAIAFDFKDLAGTRKVALLGPDLPFASSVRLLDGNQVRFDQDAPLTSWRSDSGSGLVNFGLRAGGRSQTLLLNATGGAAGSLNAANALAADPAYGWLSTEEKAVGSRTVVAVPDLRDQAWTPTASRDGVELELLGVSVDGNQVTARFAGGVTGVLWQAAGTASATLPAPAAVEVQRLASNDNAIGFYKVDGITGSVAGLNPGDAGYLQAALARSEQAGLLLQAGDLPGFGESRRFETLPLDIRDRYGVLLLQDGDRSRILSSFAAANPGGQVQMLSLASSTNALVLGIEDLSVANGSIDRDFNDAIIRITNVSVGLF